MNSRAIIYIALAVAATLTIGIICGSAWSNHRIAKLEQSVNEAKRTANDIQRTAADKELQAAEYKQKIEFLERQLADIQTLARRQDEELKTINDRTNSARGDVLSARRTRSIAVGQGELCQKLAELGHGC